MLVQSDLHAELPQLFAATESLNYFNCVELRFLDPIRPEGAHILGSGTADDDIHYHLKGNQADCLSGANEFVLTHLARLAKLPTVNFKPVRYRGHFYFGSETIHGVCAPTEIVGILNGRLASQGASSALSRILVFDLLMGNPDRHFKNFLIVKRDDQARTIRVIDFSTAGLASQCWRACQPLSPRSETLKLLDRVRTTLGADKDAGRSVLTMIGALPSHYWSRLSDQFPCMWFNSPHFIDFNDWWNNGRRDSLELANRELDTYA